MDVKISRMTLITVVHVDSHAIVAKFVLADLVTALDLALIVLEVLLAA